MCKEKSSFSIGIVFMLVVALFFSSRVMAKSIELKISSYEPEQSYLIQNIYLPYCAEIEKRTNGRVTFKWYHSGSLVKAPQTYKALLNGLVDVVASVGIWTQENQFPVNQVFTLPFLFDNSHQVDLTYLKAVETIPELQKEYSKIKMLGFHGTDLANISTNVAPPKTMADMKGLKLWGGSRTSVLLIQQLGGTPRNVRLTDLYMSLQKRAIDGVVFPTSPLAAYKLTDVLSNHCIVKSTLGLIPFAMSLKTWNKLPPEVQKVFEEMKPSVTSLLGAVVDNRRDYLLKQLKKRGDNIYYLPETERARWRKKSQPIYDQWLKLMKSKGVDGQAVLDKVRAIAAEMKNAPVTEAQWWGSDWKK